MYTATIFSESGKPLIIALEKTGEALAVLVGKSVQEDDKVLAACEQAKRNAKEVQPNLVVVDCILQSNVVFIQYHGA
jgi:hypothetical protein